MPVPDCDDISATPSLLAYTSRRTAVRRAAVAGLAAGAALAVTATPFRSTAAKIPEGTSTMIQSTLTRETLPQIITPTPSVRPDALVVAPDEGEVLDFTPTEQITWKATGDVTDGAFDTFVARMTPGYPGAPEHIHDSNEEIFYVLEGAFRFKIGDEMIDAPAGTFAYVPRGTAHTWVNIDTRVSRLLTQFLPGDMSGFFAATTDLVQAVPPDMEALAAAVGRFNTRIVGPPMLP